MMRQNGFSQNFKGETAVVAATIYQEVRAAVRASIVHQLQNSVGDR
jgi:hypothetical protein